ncbi:hypothetical protein AAFF_G00078980 [Aldrovandia affinis]|uniref:Uncharacterized protein n=1 Tax=Aldrovandia affinis TaxID=143900 RepID=A0AAD7RXL3_9TELE|nr:hypothetical protein AAFF_G00078980 [Aldrovandia affinis]
METKQADTGKERCRHSECIKEQRRRGIFGVSVEKFGLFTRVNDSSSQVRYGVVLLYLLWRIWLHRCPRPPECRRGGGEMWPCGGPLPVLAPVCPGAVEPRVAGGPERRPPMREP